MLTFNLYSYDGFRFVWECQIIANSVKEARKQGAARLGGERLEFVPGKPKRVFRVSLVKEA